MDLISIIQQLRIAKKKADHIVMIFHAGDEHFQNPRPNLVKLYRFLIDEGATIIVNHHQHCINGYEEYNGGLIFYGLGNFCFDKINKRNSPWNKGYFVELDFSEKTFSYTIHPYIQCDVKPLVRRLTSIETEDFNNEIHYLNSIIKDPIALKNKYDQWINENKDRYKSYLSPYSSKYIRFLVRKKLLPSFIKGIHSRILYLMISCESHRESIIKILEKIK
ncbi:MAG: hypothetical protein HDR88_04255 [Bacteroides sp.]|nr:hypothetical protein [Bacteroides sp.]